MSYGSSYNGVYIAGYVGVYSEAPVIKSVGLMSSEGWFVESSDGLFIEATN